MSALGTLPPFRHIRIRRRLTRFLLVLLWLRLLLWRWRLRRVIMLLLIERLVLLVLPLRGLLLLVHFLVEIQSKIQKWVLVPALPQAPSRHDARPSATRFIQYALSDEPLPFINVSVQSFMTYHNY